VTDGLRASLPKEIPECYSIISSLNNLPLKKLDELDAKVFGGEFLNNEIGNFSVGAMQLRNYLLHLKESACDSLVTADIILHNNESANYPSISGIVLTGNIVPDDSILKLIEGLTSIVPIISVEGGTYSITNKIGDIKAKIYADNKQKLRLNRYF
jgi:phosphate acetyltransferase